MRSSTSNTNSTSNSTNKRKLQQILPIPSNSLNSNTDTNNIQDLKSTPLKPKKKYNKKRKLLSNKSNYIPSVTTKIINKNPPEFQDQPKPRHLKSCSRCRKHKTKCDYINTQPFPCSSCNKKGLTCELEIVIPIKRSNIIKNLSDNIDDLKLKVDELLANHIVLQKKCIEKGLKVDGLLDINTINYFNTEESQENNNNLLDFNMEYEDEDEDEEVFPVADAADAHADSERETSVEEEEEEEEEEHAEETENDINETKLPTSTSMLHSNSRSNSTNKLFSPVSTATSLSSDEDEAEVDKLSINEEFEKDECGFIKSDYSIDEINYIENKNHNNDQLNEFNLIINNSIVKSISLHDVLDHFKFFNNNYINLLLSIIKPIKDPNYYFKNFNLKFWIIVLLCERKSLNIELFNYIKLKLNELLLINNTNNYSNESNKISLNIELVESIIILTTFSIELKIDDDLTYYNWLLNLKNIYSIDSNYNSNCSSSSISLLNDYLKYINNLGIQYSLKLGLSWPDNKLLKNNNDNNNNQEDNNLLENYNLNYSSKLSQEYLNCSYETNKLLADILKLDSIKSSSNNDSTIKSKQSNFINLNYKILKLRNKIENNYFNSNSIVKNSINNYYKIILSLNLDQLDLVLNLIYLKFSLKDSIKDQFKFSNKIFKNCLVILDKLNLLGNFSINNIDFFYNLPNYIKNIFQISILLLFNLNNSIFKFKFDKKLINHFNKIFKDSYTIIFKNRFTNSSVTTSCSDLSIVDSNNLLNLLTSSNLNFKLNKFNYFNSNLIISSATSSSHFDNNFKISFNSIIKNSNNIISQLLNSNKKSELNETELIDGLSGLLSERFDENFNLDTIKELLSYDTSNDLENFNTELVFANSQQQRQQQQQQQQIEKSEQTGSTQTPFAAANSPSSSSSFPLSTQNSPISLSDSINKSINSPNNTNIPVPKILDDNKFYLIDDKQLELTINNLVNDDTIDLSQRSEEENLNALNYLLKGIC